MLEVVKEVEINRKMEHEQMKREIERLQIQIREAEKRK